MTKQLTCNDLIKERDRINKLLKNIANKTKNDKKQLALKKQQERDLFKANNTNIKTLHISNKKLTLD